MRPSRPGTARSLSLFLLLALVASPAAAQRDGEPVTVTGTVVDAATGAPLAGAAVRVEEGRIAYTGQDGRFTIYRAPAGTVGVVASNLGYQTPTTVTELRTGSALWLELQTDPLLIEGVQVVADRFRNRRRAVPVAVQAIERRELATSAAPNALALVQQRTGLTPTRCRDAYSGANACAVVRGLAQPIRVVIDDAPVLGGLDYLPMFRPQELYLVESYGGGRHIRIYTTYYAENVMRGRIRPMPVLF